MDGYIGVVMLFAGNFNPMNWMFCEGQLLSINAYQALYAVIGTTYGGDGRTNFALPDLRGRAPIGVGSGPGLSTYNIGQKAGFETVTLSQAEMPMHNHLINAVNSNGTVASPIGKVLAISNGEVQIDRDSYPFQGKNYGDNPNTTLNANSISSIGNNTAHNNMQPYLAMRYIICVEGMFPSRS